jgi:ankyrin repeat protein
MLAGAVSAGDCLRLSDNEFWRKTLPTLDEVQSELSKGADINGRGFGGQTPLHYAAKYSRPEIILFFVEKGARLEAGTADRQTGIGDRTPLHYAVHLSGRKAENAVALIQAGANVNARDNSGHTPLMLAVKRQNAEVVNILLDAGANAQLRNRRKEIAFDYARGKPEWIDHPSTYKRLKAASGE